VVCAKFINELKSAMTEKELRSNIPRLACHFETGKPLTRAQFKASLFNPRPKPGLGPVAGLPVKKAPLRGNYNDCRICGRRITAKKLYCQRCKGLVHERTEAKAKRAALKAAYDGKRDCFRCHYTGIAVDLGYPYDQYHLSFDHRLPGEKGNLVVSIRLVNMMKSQFADYEFITLVKQLARHFRTEEPFDLGGVKFEYWKRPRMPRP
jgi:hypothetical protein